MLCLTRGPHETIHISTSDGEIVITVLERRYSSPGTVRLGITAPKKCNVLRGELIEREKQNGNRLDKTD